MLILSMEKQAHVEMAHQEIQEGRPSEPMDEVTEEQFLKNLYLFMKKRDTPIERIPHLGFKQIDLFLMFKTVRDFGGYHQVTAQQLWKQVYNTLGGNPRSTSAATCTRRHYEKLLLPYECHVKGILMNILPPHQSKHFHFANYTKDNDDDGQRPAKRKPITIPLHPSPYNHQSEPHQNLFPLPLYPHYHHLSYPGLLSHVPFSSSVLPSHSPPSPKHQFTVNPSFSTPTDEVKGPLEHLRSLADKYKYSAGLTEPLNLSVRAQSQESKRNTASSFAPPSKPKFLNEASTLYTSHHQQAVKNEGSETQDGEAADGVSPHLYPGGEKDAYIIDVKSASSSPTYDCGPTPRTDEGTTATAQNPSSPKTDFPMWPKEERGGSPEERRLSLSHVPPIIPRDNGGKMEIEIPLSVLHEWLRLSSATMQGAIQLTACPPQEECMSSHLNPQQQSPNAEDLRPRQKDAPSPTPANQTTSNQHKTSQSHFINYKPLPSGSILKNASSRDVYPVDQQNIMKAYINKTCWDTCDKETQALKMDSSPLTVQQDLTVTKPYSENTGKGRKERPEMMSSAVVMVDSSPASVLHFTPEEVMKLKRIISSSL